MEIERKFLLSALPEKLDAYPHRRIEQGYLCTDPVIRIRRQDDSYILTCKSRGLMSREEFELPLTAESYAHLKPKADGFFISKTRYLIPIPPYTVELDVFDEGLVMAEVEFPSEEAALSFRPPVWFGREVTSDARYQNSSISKNGFPAE